MFGRRAILKTVLLLVVLHFCMSYRSGDTPASYFCETEAKLTAAILPSRGRGFLPAAPPLLFAHRGDPFEVPEHTLASYASSMRHAIDYVEIDIGLTSDGVPVCIHDLDLAKTTDVASRPVFRGRRRRLALRHGAIIDGWFVHDLSLAEIKQLRVRRRRDNRSAAYDGQFEVPTLGEALALIRRTNEAQNTNIGAFIEPKHPTHYQSVGKDYISVLLDTLRDHGYHLHGKRRREGGEKPANDVMIECFEAGFLQKLRPLVDIPLVMLLNLPDVVQEDALEPYRAVLQPERLEAIATFADGIGIHKGYLYESWINRVSRSKPSNFLVGRALIEHARRNQLQVYAWTCAHRQEDRIVQDVWSGDEVADLQTLLDFGVDGVFTEHAELAASILKGV